MIEHKLVRRVYVLESVFPVVVIRPAGPLERTVHAFRLKWQGLQEKRAARIAAKMIEKAKE